MLSSLTCLSRALPRGARVILFGSWARGDGFEAQRKIPNSLAWRIEREGREYMNSPTDFARALLPRNFTDIKEIPPRGP